MNESSDEYKLDHPFVDWDKQELDDDAIVRYRLESPPRMSTRERVDWINKEIDTLEDLKEEIRKECDHEIGTYEYASNTGGYDGPDFDTYWIYCICSKCGKRWTVDNRDDDYNKIPMKSGWNSVKKGKD